jgi:uncharacterized protein
LNYFDTSYLVPLVIGELYSSEVATFLATLDRRTLATSHWTLVEFASTLARGVRMGRFSRVEADRLQAEFDRIVQGSFSLLLHTEEDYAIAAAFLARGESLRAPDAMHLAITGNHTATAILSLDKKMIVEGRLLRLPISTGIPLPGYPEVATPYA